MNWLLITILAYFFLAIVSLFDRYFLVGPIPNPKVYTFYGGILCLFACLILIPFGIIFPERDIIFIGLGAGLIRILAILFLTESIVRSEVSRVVPAIGGFLPIFTFLLFFFHFPEAGILNSFQITAFVLLILGSVLISLKDFSLRFFTFETLKYPMIAAFLFASSFFLSKKLYLETNFLNGLFLILFGGGLGAVIFLFFREIRESIFTKRITRRISGFFLLGQTFGGTGIFLQQFAVFLANPGQVPLINALEGTRYIFLLFFVFLLAKKFPQLLKEEISRKILFQKIIAIFLIGAGLLILSIY